MTESELKFIKLKEILEMKNKRLAKKMLKIKLYKKNNGKLDKYYEKVLKQINVKTIFKKEQKPNPETKWQEKNRKLKEIENQMKEQWYSNNKEKIEWTQ